ncbi:carbohydrate kinase family protein [Nonomuraea sp. NPDC051941]|uniref:carbohydrate kinase family protein n=1 Tax=Nonomuraea sp. NPDC051941 TaxID=3364373 RepID=UPI0037C7086D
MGAAASPVYVFGDVCLHVTIRPSGSGKFCAGDVRLDPGGSAAMVAWQLAALERPVAMVGVAGQDHAAKRLRDRLVAVGVDCSCWTSVVGETARVAIFVEPGGDHRVVVEQGDVTRPGEALAARVQEVDLPEDALCYVPGFPAYDAVRTALLDRSLRVVCDFGFRPWLTDIDTAVAQIVPRACGVAVAVCSGASFAEADNRLLAQHCIAAGASAVVTSLGSEGCLVSDARGTTHRPGVSVRPVNTLGAGDSLVAGLLAGLANGFALEQACVFAQMVAAAKITKLVGPARNSDVQALLGTAGRSR